MAVDRGDGLGWDGVCNLHVVEFFFSIRALGMEKARRGVSVGLREI